MIFEGVMALETLEKTQIEAGELGGLH